MNVKNKIVALAMSFVICFCSVSYGFCDDEKYIKYDDLVVENVGSRSVLTVGSYVLTKEAFNIIVGVASACGVALLTDVDKFDFVDKFIEARLNTKVDSGDFTTSPTKQEIVDDFQNEIKNGSSKDPGNDKNIIVNSTLVAGIISIFDKLFEKENEPIYHFDKIPIYPNYLNLKEEYGHNVEISFRTSDGQQMKSKYYKGNYHLIYLSSSYNDSHNGSRSSFTNSDSLSYVPCGSSYCSTGHKYYDVPGYYHLGVGLSSSNGFNYKAVYNSSVSSPMEGEPFTFYIPTKKFMSNYKPVPNINKVSNGDVGNSTNPNYVVNGSVELPPGSPGGGSIDFEMPPLPSFDDEVLDLSFISDLFEHLKGKFPFSIPFDLYNLIDVLRTEPVPPKFDFKFLDNEVCLDLTQFEDWANIVRAFSVFSWVFVLFAFTKKLGG